MSLFPTMPGAAIDRAVAAAATAGAEHMAELLRAVRRGEIALVQPLDRSAPVSMARLKRAPRPVLVVIGDDDYCSTGPSGWACLPTLLCWARGAIVHGTGANVESYRGAVAMAQQTGRGVLVETSSGCAVAWREAFRTAGRPVQTLTLLPHGGVHPLMPARGAMQ
jgi:hypothetical protein